MNPDGMVALLNYRVSHFCCLSRSLILQRSLGGWCYPYVSVTLPMNHRLTYLPDSLFHILEAWYQTSEALNLL